MLDRVEGAQDSRLFEGTTPGIFFALAGFGIWGLFPIYFKALSHVPALEVLSHRIVWSVVLLAITLMLTGKQRECLSELRSLPRLSYYLFTTLLIAGNWLVYIWAVQHGRILEASLGYYINPLVSVLLGVSVLGERLSRRQSLAVALAGIGVLFMVIRHGTIPWISLFLAFSFGGYGLLRKRAKANALVSLFLETLLMAPLALGFLILLAARGDGALGIVNRQTDALLIMAGFITVVPLALFLEATQRLRLSTIGVIQYLTPTLQFLLAVAVYQESFTAAHWVTFGFIWTALAIYSADAFSARSSREPELNAGRS